VNPSQNEAPTIPENPFFYRGPIRDRRYFFGRTRETHRALQMLRNGQCISTVGPRRIGKTSLLFHLRDSEVQQEHNLGEEYLFVYIDCQGLGNLDKTRFYQWLWEETKRALAERGEADGWAESISDFNEFREAVMTIKEKGYKLALLFDEFDTTAKNPNLDQDLFSDLRSLGSPVYTVVYVTASVDSLFDLTYADTSVLSSPFFNIFDEIHLGFLRPMEAKDMILGLLRMTEQENLFTEEDLAFVFEAGGYFPLFFQLACYHLFARKMECKELVATDYEIVRRQYANDAEPHFRYIWENLDANEQKAVRLVCGGKVSRIDDEQKRRLERKCILYDSAIFSSSFAEFVQRPSSAVSHGEPERTVESKRPIRESAYTVRATALLAALGLIIGWFGVRVSSLVAVFFAGGLLLIALWLLVSNWPGRTR